MYSIFGDGLNFGVRWELSLRDFITSGDPLGAIADAFTTPGHAGKGNDDIRAQGILNVVHGGMGNDTIQGISEALTIFGLSAYNGSSYMFGHDGQDTISAFGNGGSWIRGGDGVDILRGGAGKDTLYGGEGNDRIYGGGGEDHLFGNAGNDTLSGGVGKDVLDGGDGDDTLHGGQDREDDLLTGGAGRDRFFSILGDRILDFDPDEDYPVNGRSGRDGRRRR